MKKTCKGCNNKIFKVIDICKSPACDLYLKNKKNLKLYSLDLYFCNKCKLIQLSDIVSPEKIYNQYLYKSQHSVGLVEHFKNYCETVIKKLKLNTSHRILDIGCNDGTLLNFFVKKGYKVLGVDPASNISEECKKKNIKLINSFFNKKLVKNFITKNYSFDLITANNVIANIPKLGEFFSLVSKLLSNKGYFVFETIDGPSLIKNKFVDMINSEHIYYFSITSIKTLLDMYDLEIFLIENIKLKGGSFRVYAKKKQKVISVLKKNSIKFKNYLIEEKKNGFTDLKKIKKYNKIYSLEKKNFEIFLKKLSLKSKIFAYGASAGSTSLIYFYNLHKIISFIVDDNKLRVNLYTPGSKIKILHPSKILLHNPDYILILAWRYKKQILAKNKMYIKNGGKFLSLYPRKELIK
jgi:2-polyprenyl-3-methyl-5-hydroxy-6-metoxy-1,4-benzoquinol methylase